jgi:hypothetical protein
LRRLARDHTVWITRWDYVIGLGERGRST